MDERSERDTFEGAIREPAIGPAGAPGPGDAGTAHRSRAVRGGVALFTLAGLGLGVGIGYVSFSGGRSPATTASSLSTLAATVDPGLVDVYSTLGYQGGEAAGTGMVLTSTGEVLTNNHVIDGATSITVTDVGNGRTYRATVVGYDTSADVAVLQLVGASGLSTVTLASSSSASVGQSVVAIGNAGGSGGTPKMVSGTVTALDQSITAGDSGSARVEHLSGLIETDAAIQAGYSGGPLVNAAGQVIGMDTAASATSGVTTTAEQAYAIPIATAVAVAHEIESGGSSSSVHIGQTAFLGVAVSGSGAARGVEVLGVEGGSPAASVGLQAGDEITRVDGTAVTSPTALSAVIEGVKPGTTVTLTWTAPTGQAASASARLVAGPAG